MVWIERGIPAAAITRDDAGLRTLDSMVRARQVFGLTSIVVVTQEFHMARSLYLARAFGLHAVGFAASDDGGDFYDSHVREWLARVKAFADINWLGTQPAKLGPPMPIQLGDQPRISMPVNSALAIGAANF